MMSMVIKFVVLFTVWVLFGAAVYWITCFSYSIRVGLLNPDDVDGIMAEYVSLITNGLIRLDKDEDTKSLISAVENITGEPLGKSWLKMWIIWPHTMSVVKPRLDEAYQLLREKYGLGSRKSAS